MAILTNIFVMSILVSLQVNGLLVVDDIYTLSNDPNDVHFYLFPIAGNTNFSQEIIFNDVNSLDSSLYQRGHKTVFIIHGFRSNVSSDMPQTVKNAYLNSGLNNNYIVVSWGALSTPQPPALTGPLYSLVTLNVPIVATRVAAFISFLYNNQAVNFNDIHMVGHSLGAHVSGLTGLYIQQQFQGQQIARITGLDPAGPLFLPPIQCRNLVKTDAAFVDVIHTNMGNLGDITQDGDADFYPNGGYTQTGCAEADLVGTPPGDPNTLGRCSHWFSYRLYAASMVKTFTACQCNPIILTPVATVCGGICSKTSVLGLNCPSTYSLVGLFTDHNPNNFDYDDYL